MRSNSPPYRGRPMGKHEIIEDTRAPSGEAEASGASATEPHATKTSNAASAGADAGEGVASQTEAGALKSATAAPQAGSSGRPDSLDVASGIDQPKPSRGKAAADAEDALPEAGEEARRASRFALLAAALALAAALRAMIGALARYGLAPPAAPAAVAGRTGLDDIPAAQGNVVPA